MTTDTRRHIDVAGYFGNDILTEIYSRMENGERHGQAVFNTFANSQQYGGIVDIRIRGTLNDCYYNDAKVYAFLMRVLELLTD